MARIYPHLAPLHELRHTLSQLQLNDLAVGEDGRNRCLLSPFRSKTGRNQPSNNKFIFGPSVWLRGLIKAPTGMAVAYVDWEQQEFGIAGALSDDRRMMAADESGDPYLTFAKQAGAIPEIATKNTHKDERERFKICALAVQYGMGSRSLAQLIGKPEPEARELLRLHRRTYPKFWEWSEAMVDQFMLLGHIQTILGWRLLASGSINPRSVQNFPVQATGSELLRLACCLLTERGIRVCGPIHDAVLIESSVDTIENDVEATREMMREASSIVLDGFSLRTDAALIRYPDRYMDARGQQMWDTVSGILTQLREADRPSSVPIRNGGLVPQMSH